MVILEVSFTCFKNAFGQATKLFSSTKLECVGKSDHGFVPDCISSTIIGIQPIVSSHP